MNIQDYKPTAKIKTFFNGLIQSVLLKDRMTLSMARDIKPSTTVYPSQQITSYEAWRQSLHLSTTNSFFYLGDKQKITLNN